MFGAADRILLLSLICASSEISFFRSKIEKSP